MKKISNRTWLIAGFALTLVSVVTNVLVVSAINKRVSTVEAEIAKLESSIRTQTDVLDRTDIKFDLFRVVHHISKLSAGGVHKAAGQDALRLLQDYLKGYYTAVNDIPPSELLRSEQGKIAAMLPIIDKIHEAERLEEAGNAAEAKRIAEEADAMFAAYRAPDELGRNIDDLVAFLSDPDLAEKPTLDVTAVMVPRVRDLVARYLSNYEANSVKLAELRKKRGDLVGWANLATYAAVSLQLFALFFFFAKDLAKEAKAE